MPPTRVAVVPHTHWDREWYSPFQIFRMRLVELLDELLVALEADPGYGQFLLDGQMAVVDDYLAVRPDAEDSLRRLVGSGRVAVGPWYTLPDEFCVSGETLVRNLQLGVSRAGAFGGAMQVGYLPDMFGHIGQMPQLLQLFGFDHAVVWRGVPAAVDRTAFWWSSPDGSEVRATYLWHGYGNGAALPGDAKALMARLRAMAHDIGDALAGEMLVMNGTDHQPPQRWLARVVSEVNDLQDEVELVVTSLPEALAHSWAAMEPTDQRALPRWRGELRSGARANLLMGVASNRLDLHQAGARAERALERLAEPLSTLWRSPEHWPGAMLEAAWLEVVRNSAHDSCCGCSADDVCSAVLHRYTEARHIAEGLTERALTELASRQRRPGTVIANPTARRRGGVVEIVIAGHGPVSDGQLVEDLPTVLTDRAMSPEEARNWMLWFRSPRIDDATHVQRAEVAETDHAIELTLHCRSRGATDLAIEDLKSDVRARMDARPGTPLHLHVVREPHRRVLWRVEDVPGYGWRRWSAVASPAPPVRPRSSNGLTNGLLTVEVDTDGTFQLNGLAGMGRLVDSGDHGDTYNYSPPDADVHIDRPESASVTMVEGGPVRGRLRIVSRYVWPSGIDESTRSRTGAVSVTVTTELELRAGEAFVRVSHAWDNRCRDHRVRTVLPLPRPARASRAECAFAVVERGLHAEGGPTEKALATSFSRRFVSAGDLTVVHDGLLEYELTDRAGRSVAGDAREAQAISLTLLRATGMLSRAAMTNRSLPAGPAMALEGAQRQGPVALRYAVCCDPDVDPYVLADDVLIPLQVVVAHGGGTETAEHGQGLCVEGAEVSALMRENNHVAVRAFNPHDDPSELRLPGRSGWVVDLSGRVLAPFSETVALRPWEIVTLRLR